MIPQYRIRNWSSQIIHTIAYILNGGLFLAGLLYALAGCQADSSSAEHISSILLGLGSTLISVVNMVAVSHHIGAFSTVSRGLAYVLNPILVYLGLSAWRASFELFSQKVPPVESITYMSAAAVTLGTLITSTNDETRRRRLSRIAITLLILSCIGALLFLWLIDARVESVISQSRAAEKVQALGGVARWEHWSVVAVYLKNTDTRDDDLAFLEDLPNLQSLYLSDTGITDASLKRAAKMEKLHYLYLDNTQVTDRGLKELEDLGSLRSISVGGTRITESGVRNLKRALPGLDINRGGKNGPDRPATSTQSP